MVDEKQAVRAATEEEKNGGKTLAKPKGLLQTALKAVKGDRTEELIEQFTSEMTLVAEGLCDDQERLRRDLESFRTEQDRALTAIRSEQEAQDQSWKETQRDIDRRQDEMNRRLDALENKVTALENKLVAKKKEPQKENKWKELGLIGQLCVLVGLIGVILLLVLLVK